MKYNISIILVFAYYVSFAQYDLDKNLNKADSLMEGSNFIKAFETYQEIIDSTSTGYFPVYYGLVKSGVKANKEEQAKKAIHFAVTSKGLKKEQFECCIKKHVTESFYNDLLEEYDSLRHINIGKINDIDVYLEIQQLIERDQFVRRFNQYLNGYSSHFIDECRDSLESAKSNNDSTRIKQFDSLVNIQLTNNEQLIKTKLMHNIDSLNISRFIEITKEYGWKQEGWLLLWHHRNSYGEDNYIWNHFKPLINKEIKEGKLNKEFWQMFEMFGCSKNVR